MDIPEKCTEIVQGLLLNANLLIEEAFDEAIKQHEDIPKELWAPAMWMLLMEGYLKSGSDCQKFREIVETAYVEYERMWKETGGSNGPPVT